VLIEKPAASIKIIDEIFSAYRRIYCLLSSHAISQDRIGSWRTNVRLASWPYESQMVAVGYIVLVLGILVWLYGELRFLVVAYRRNLWWFFGCLFVPFVPLIFLFMNWKATIGAYVLATAGLLITGAGAWMAGVAVPS
jgi:hypothetical protein